MSYKYDHARPNPEQTGVYIEETVTAPVNNRITTSYRIATKLAREFWIHDPDSHGSYAYGVAKLYNETSSTDVFANITGAGSTYGKQVTTSSGIAATEQVTVGYYAIGTEVGTTTQLPDSSSDWDNSMIATPEIFQSLFNNINFKSPINLFQLGYLWADKMMFIDVLGEDIGSTPITESNFTFSVQRDTVYPFVVTEIRFVFQNDDIRVTPVVGAGSRQMKFGEGANDYFDLDSTSSAYATNALTKILSADVGMIVGDSIQFTLTKGAGFGNSDRIIIEVAGFYIPPEGGL